MTATETEVAVEIFVAAAVVAAVFAEEAAAAVEAVEGSGEEEEHVGEVEGEDRKEWERTEWKNLTDATIQVQS